MRSTKMLARLRRVSPARVRLVAIIAAALLVGLAFLTANVPVRATYTRSDNSALELRLLGAQAEFWWHNPRSLAYWADMAREPAPVASSFRLRPLPDWTAATNLAWRPYHIAKDPWPASSSHHAVAVPLWTILIPAFLLAAYAHGLVVGTRRGNKASCSSCGYPRNGLATQTPCPECGFVPQVSLEPASKPQPSA